jgi:hypothetical protein
MTATPNPKVERAVWAHSEPTTTLHLPGGFEQVVCLACGDELRTTHPGMATTFRHWHLIQHLHVEDEAQR